MCSCCLSDNLIGTDAGVITTVEDDQGLLSQSYATTNTAATAAMVATGAGDATEMLIRLLPWCKYHFFRGKL